MFDGKCVVSIYGDKKDVKSKNLITIIRKKGQASLSSLKNEGRGRGLTLKTTKQKKYSVRPLKKILAKILGY